MAVAWVGKIRRNTVSEGTTDRIVYVLQLKDCKVYVDPKDVSFLPDGGYLVLPRNPELHVVNEEEALNA